LPTSRIEIISFSPQKRAPAMQIAGALLSRSLKN